MAIGWMTVIKAVPWGEVIANAPRIAGAAKKLLSGAAGTQPATDKVAPGAADVLQGGDSLESRLRKVEADAAALHRQLLASSELIRNLAEQNEQLVVRIDANRARLGLLTAASVILGIAVAVLLLAMLRA